LLKVSEVSNVPNRLGAAEVMFVRYLTQCPSGRMQLKNKPVLVAHAYNLATQEAEIRRIMVQSQPGQIVHKTLSSKSSTQKKAGGVTQGIGPEFKPHTPKKKQKNVIQI
jgi:hypothetical protein